MTVVSVQFSENSENKKMMIGNPLRSNPTVQIPPSWDCHFVDDPTATIHSPLNTFAALQRYLQSNKDGVVTEEDGNGVMVEEDGFDDFDFPVDAFSCDDFRMFEFKVKKCVRVRSHDWTECPFAHPGEKARRRDPRKFQYSGAGCPDFKKGVCRKGDLCEYAHGVFESWLHPARYRTQPCKDGTHCRRRVCFFAHTQDQLRVFSYTSPDCSPSRLGQESFSRNAFGKSPNASPATGSPPVSPSGLTESIRGLQINSVRMGLTMSPPTWGLQMGSGFGSPRSPPAFRPGFLSLPSTPVWTRTRSGLGAFDISETTGEDDPEMERVESGRDLRAKIYAKLSKENSLHRIDSGNLDTDVGWVSELVE
ncbi:Zinc finger CCCH domain-containing protein 20 [Abeliophyllum distichum]|uniref:Zinc finger CCCH domain-containing protein 20 n=1 Tax=Abeliophyllum distichum TaxID=126358 RepID=A0ABD1UKL8_9LAMI